MEKEVHATNKSRLMKLLYVPWPVVASGHESNWNTHNNIAAQSHAARDTYDTYDTYTAVCGCVHAPRCASQVVAVREAAKVGLVPPKVHPNLWRCLWGCAVGLGVGDILTVGTGRRVGLDVVGLGGVGTRVGTGRRVGEAVEGECVTLVGLCGRCLVGLGVVGLVGACVGRPVRLMCLWGAVWGGFVWGTVGTHTPLFHLHFPVLAVHSSGQRNPQLWCVSAWRRNVRQPSRATH